MQHCLNVSVGSVIQPSARRPTNYNINITGTSLLPAGAGVCVCVCAPQREREGEGEREREREREGSLRRTPPSKDFPSGKGVREG